MPHSEITKLQTNPRVFKPFREETSRIVIFDNDEQRTRRIIAEGVKHGYRGKKFTVIQPEEYESFLESYSVNAKYIQHIVLNYNFQHKGENLYKLLRRIDVSKSKVWYLPEKFDEFLSTAFDGLLAKINLCENDIVHNKHLVYSRRKSYFFELLTEQLHKIADDEKLLEAVGQNVVERILQEILATRIKAKDGTEKELSLEYFLPVSNGLSISLIHEEGGLEYLVNESTCINNLPEFGSKRVITSGIRNVIVEGSVGVIQDFSHFLAVEPDHEVIRTLYGAGLNSSIYTVIHKPGQDKPFGMFFGYSSQQNIFNRDHEETIGKLAKLVGLFYEKINKNKEVHSLTDELLEGIGDVRKLQDMMMGTEILSTKTIKDDFKLDIDCYIRHPFISNNSFVSLNGDGLKFKLLNDSKLQITNFDICDHGIYSGMLGLITHTLIDTISKGETSTALLLKNDIQAYLEKFAREIYDFYFYNLSKGDYTNIAKNMGVFNNVIFDREEECSYLLRLGFHSPIFYSAQQGKLDYEEEWNKYNNLIVGIDPFQEVDETNIQRVCFSAGDILLFYSDGLSEQQNGSEEFYGTDRIKDVIIENADQEAWEIKEKIIENFMDFLGGDEITNDDDLSFIIIKKL